MTLLQLVADKLKRELCVMHVALRRIAHQVSNERVHLGSMYVTVKEALALEPVQGLGRMPGAFSKILDPKAHACQCAECQPEITSRLKVQKRAICLHSPKWIPSIKFILDAPPPTENNEGLA